jgi:PAS domain S-box-containing protein
MARPTSVPTGRTVTFDEDEIIVSKTDLRGIITYANDVFVRVSGYAESELLGAPHNILRHPEMPACVFRLLWDTLEQRKEIFAYVNNMAKNGDSYWVFAHVTPSFDGRGRVVGYHSNRRVPYADALEKVKPLYAALLAEEKRHASRQDGIQATLRMVEDVLKGAGMTYSEFVFSLSKHTRLGAAA